MAKLNVRGNAMMEQLSKDSTFHSKESVHLCDLSAKRIWTNYRHYTTEVG